MPRLLEVEHVQAWERAHGPLPEGGWLLYRTGWDARADSQEEALDVDETGPHSPGVSVECARWLAEETALLGLGTETVGGLPVGRAGPGQRGRGGARPARAAAGGGGR